MIEDNGSAQLTAAYVEQLRVALKLKNEECQELHEANLELNDKLADMHEDLKEIESRRDFEASRAELAMSCNKISADPSHVVRIVSSWLPEYTDATMACCIKVGEAWIIVEEKAECQRMSHSTLLDEIILRNDEFNGDSPAADIIPESVLYSLGWSHSHESLAISLYSRCVWVIIGVGAKEAARVALGFHSILSTATELIMSSVLQQMEKNAEFLRLCRIETSLEMCRLLLSASYLTPSCRSISSSREVPQEGVSAEPSGPVAIWRDLPHALGMCLDGLDCDLLLFHRDAQGGVTVLSSVQGAWYRPSSSTSVGSLAETAISTGTELLVCCDPSNVSRHARIDCGLDQDQAADDVSASELVTSIAVAPIWPQTPRHTVSHSDTSPIHVTGAVVFRLRDRSFTEAEVNVMLEVVRDNFGILRDWLNCNVGEVIRVLAADGNLTSSQMQVTEATRTSNDSSGSGITSKIANVRHCLEWYLGASGSPAVRLTSSSTVQRACLVQLIAESFACDWAVVLLPQTSPGVSQDEHNSAALSGQNLNLLVVDDLGHIRDLEICSEGLDSDMLTQSIKFLLARQRERGERSSLSEVDKRTCVILNNMKRSSQEAGGDGDPSVSATAGILPSLLHASSPHRPRASPPNPLSALLPEHVMCTTLKLRSVVDANGEAEDEHVVVLAGRQWQPLLVDEVSFARQELQQAMSLMDACREKDSLVTVADELAEQVTILKEKAEERGRADEDLESFAAALESLHSHNRFSGGLLQVMDTYKASTFGHDSLLMVCVSEDITKRLWVLGNTKDSSGVWLPLDRQLAAAVEWTMLNTVDSQSLSAEPNRTLNVVTNSITGRTLPGYHMCSLFSERATDTTLHLALLVFCPLDASLHGPTATRWVSLLRTSVLPRAFALLHPHSLSQGDTNGQGVSAVSLASTYTTAIASEFVATMLADHSWMDWTLSPLAGRLPAESVAETIRSNSVWSHISYLCSTSLWQRLSSYCDIPVRVAVPAIAVPLLPGSNIGREYCMVDLLRCEQDMSSNMQEAFHKNISGAVGGASSHVSGGSRERRASLSEAPHCVHWLDNEKSVVQIFSGRSAVGELLYRYLLSCDDVGDFVAQDTVILFSHVISQVASEAPCYFHIVLVVPAKLLITPQDLGSLEAVMSCAFTPLDVIKAHDNVRSDIRLMRDMALSDSRVKAAGTGQDQQPSVFSQLFQKQPSSDWSAAHSYTEKTVANMLHLCVSSAQVSASEVNSRKKGKLCVVDGAAYLYDGDDMAKCSECVASGNTTIRQRKRGFPDTIPQWTNKQPTYSNEDDLSDAEGGALSGGGAIHIDVLPFRYINGSSEQSTDGTWSDEEDEEADMTFRGSKELLQTGTYVVRIAISDSQMRFEQQGGENELAVILIRVKWNNSTSGSRRRCVEELLSKHGYSQLRLLASTAMQTLVRDNALREAHEAIVASYTSRMNHHRKQSIQCVSRIDAALSTILTDTVGIAEIFQSLRDDESLKKRVDTERQRRDSLVSCFDVDGDGECKVTLYSCVYSLWYVFAVVVSDDRHAKMIDNCFADIERKTELIRKVRWS